MNKLTKVLLVAIPLIGAAVAGLWMSTEAASVDTTRDCDNYAIIRCGTMSASELIAEYESNGASGANGHGSAQSDIQTIFAAFGINRESLNGNFVKGVVYRDGRVTVNGNVVATGAYTAIRGINKGSAIPGSSNARAVYANHMSSAQEALVKLNDKGQFVFAVMTPCGNPVSAKNVVPEPPVPTPPTPPTPTPPAPVYTCNELTVNKISRDSFKFSVTYTAANGAEFKKAIYKVYDSTGKEVYSSENGEFKGFAPGEYTVKAFIVVTVNGGEQTVTSEGCAKKVTIEELPKTPKIEIVKTVNGVESAVVEIDQPFTYEVKVKNTGEVDLVNAVVSDPAPEGVSFKSADKGTITDNKWSYTIPSLKVGEEQTFKITAVVTKQINGRVKNTACVDTPTIPGGPDGCDDAFISIKIKACNITTGVIESVEPGKENTHPYTTDLSRCEKVKVCEISTKTIVEVTRKEAEDTNRYADENSDKCKDQPVVVPPTPVAELPKTGVMTDALSVLGLGALVTTSAAYVLSRRIR